MTGAKLREEDLAPGKAWVHPDTKLEYEDYHAWFCGKDPLPHWRNARIKEFRGEWGRKQWDYRCEAIATGRCCYDREYASLAEFVAGECERITRNFDRLGQPYASPFASVLLQPDVT